MRKVGQVPPDPNQDQPPARDPLAVRQLGRGSSEKLHCRIAAPGDSGGTSSPQVHHDLLAVVGRAECDQRQVRDCNGAGIGQQLLGDRTLGQDPSIADSLEGRLRSGP